MFSVITEDSRELTYNSILFSGGEIQVRLDGNSIRHLDFVKRLHIRADLTSSDKIIELVLLVDAIRRNLYRPIGIFLTCPYLPYARQDRVCAPGEALSLRVICDLINSLKFTGVTVWDVHSDVALALLNNASNITQRLLVPKIHASKPILQNCILVSPDAGAIKKTLDTSMFLGIPMVRADKVRSTDDGSITGTVIHSDHIGDKDFLIVDDICDGGRTFIELAKVLRPLTNGKVYLYVTHGIFSKGLRVFDGLIDHIYTANPFPAVDVNDTVLTVI